jgi:hypothetical protein
VIVIVIVWEFEYRQELEDTGMARVSKDGKAKLAPSAKRPSTVARISKGGKGALALTPSARALSAEDPESAREIAILFKVRTYVVLHTYVSCYMYFSAISVPQHWQCLYFIRCGRVAWILC